jgi:hypothetical protein
MPIADNDAKMLIATRLLCAAISPHVSTLAASQNTENK